MPEPGPSKLTASNGDPLVIRERNIRNELHSIVTQNDEGDIEELKLRPTKPFLEAINSFVLRVVIECAQNAMDENRSTVMPGDLHYIRSQVFDDEDEGEDRVSGEESDG